VQDGRIHPARIEEMLNKAKADVQTKMREAAEKATSEAHVRLSKPLMEVFGRLLYRTSYGQNMLKHSVEVSAIAASIAAESAPMCRYASAQDCCMISARRSTTI
jgi:ribonuclease Y